MPDHQQPADNPQPLTATASTSAWNADGLATLEATGPDARAALEAGLRAVLNLALDRETPSPRQPEADRSAPIHGEGADLAELFANLVEDLLEQLAFFGASLDDVTIDGVLRRDDAGFVAWGHAVGSLEPTSIVNPPQLDGAPSASDASGEPISLRATLRRSRPIAAR